MDGTIVALIEKGLPSVKGRDIVIWGTRENAHIAEEALKLLGRKCEFFISSRPRANTCYGLPLSTPDVLDVKKHYVFIASASPAVEKFLRKAGYRLDGQDGIHIVTTWHDDIEYQGCSVGAGTYGYESLAAETGHSVKKIGRYCSINASARVASNHPLDYVTTSGILYSLTSLPPRELIRAKVEKSSLPATYSELPEDGFVEIGNDVWIGMNVVILPGIRVGDGAVLGAGAVVTKDVEPYAIVGGVPAKIIRYRYSKEMIDAFLRIKWWDWSIEKIEENLELFYDPEKFCKTFDSK